jgi:hypothetical protein
VPAYRKIALVTSVFHPSDVAFAQGWSRRAPGFGGWRLLLDRESGTKRVSVIPPGSDEPVFFITRDGVRTILSRLVRQEDEATLSVVGDYDNLRCAVQALCPLTEDDLQEIHEELEIAFPRNRR